MISITEVFPNVKGGKNAKEEIDFFGFDACNPCVDVFRFMPEEDGGYDTGACR
jgi:hypothetical protein